MKKTRSNYKKSRNQKEEKFYTKDDIFISRMASILLMSKGEVRSLFSQRAVSTIRLNNLAANVSEIKTKLESGGLVLKPVSWSPYTYIITNKDKSELGRMQEYQRGLFYIQNLSSILTTVILDPQKEEKILDLCAAPGSKTTHIASLTNGEAEILANDEDYIRTQKMRSVLDQFYAKSVSVSNNDGRKIGLSMPNYFDRVLLDAPCSGEGLIYLNGEKPLRFWNLKKIKVMQKVQKELILSAFDALKSGGTLVYSTCTLEPEENEAVVEYLMNERKGVHLERIDLVNSPEFEYYKQFTKPGITKWSGMKFHQELGKAIRIIPGAHMQGFFIAKITKK